MGRFVCHVHKGKNKQVSLCLLGTGFLLLLALIVKGYLDEVLLPSGDLGETRLHQSPVRVKLLRGLQEVATIGEEGSRVQGNNGQSCRPSESGNIATALIALGNILALQKFISRKGVDGEFN